MSAELLAIILASGVGLSLGALGGGGSTLAVPILVFVAGMSVTDATTASLLVVGSAAVVGAVAHARDGHVRLGTGLAFGAAGLVGAAFGTALNRHLPEDPLLIVFAVLIALVAVRMLRGCRYPTPEEEADRHTIGTGGVALVDRTRAPVRSMTAPALVRLAGAATVVGVLTGLFGVGGGFAIVPALTLLLGVPAKEAIGTSLVVIAVNAAIALAMRHGSLDLDWALVLPFLAVVAAGVVAGTAAARRADATKLTRSFAFLLLGVAAYTALGAVL